MVSIPDVPVLPLFTPLPFLITITTMTAPMNRAKALSRPPNKHIFPTPPQSHTDIHLVCATTSSFGRRGSCGRPMTTIARDVIADVEVAEKEWHPEAEEIGAGGRGGEMARAPTVAINYYLSLNAPFPGMGNDMLLKVPVAITSGLNPPWLKSDLEFQHQP